MATLKRKYHRWSEIKRRQRTPRQLAALDREVEQELLQMDLRAIREMAGKTQVDVAGATGMAQSEISRLEKREDTRLSTLRRYVESLGGKLEVIAVFGDKSVRLHTAD